MTAAGAYSDRIARRFLVASLVWGGLAMCVGLLLGLELVLWQANLTPALSFGRLRPVHTGAMVFAFVGNMVFAGVYYSSQRLLRVRLVSERLAEVHFWGWQAAIAGMVATVPLGMTRGLEYGEMEWPLELLLVLLWAAFAVQLFRMVAGRRVRRLAVSVWFYLAAVIAVGGLFVLGNLAVPASLGKSYALFGGAAGALVEWMYGHGAIEFLLTAPVVGILYFLLPRVSGRPIYSHRLAVVHFWGLVFLAVWVGPAHLLDTAMPDWIQTLGMVFGVMLWAASLAGVINGLMTVRGAGGDAPADQRDPALPFVIGALVFYALATLEGPLLGVKSVSGLAHYTDWVIGHAHAAGMGWNGLMVAALGYWLWPRLHGVKLHSRAAAGAHLYLALVGIGLYVAAMWIAGVTQGLMWQAGRDGGGLAYSFIETLAAHRIQYWARLVGGGLYLAGFVVMGWNLWRTARAGALVEEAIGDADGGGGGGGGSGSSGGDGGEAADNRDRRARLLTGMPVVVTALALALCVGAAFVNPLAALGLLFVMLVLVVGGVAVAAAGPAQGRARWHDRLERRALPFIALIALCVLVGSSAELLPALASGGDENAQVVPLSALELAGRDVYLEEGCVGCHSQMIRPFLWEVARYGSVSRPADSSLDHPFLWGSRRIGPDLARIGGKYPDLWHYQHLMDPRAVSPGSTMPPYAHLRDSKVDLGSLGARMQALAAAGVPYDGMEIESAADDALAEAQDITGELLATGKVRVAPDSKMVALIAYLQRLGRPPAVPALPAGGAP